MTDVQWCHSHKEWVLAGYNAVTRKRLGGGGGGEGGEGGTIHDALASFSQISHDPATKYLSPKEPPSSSLYISNNYPQAIPNEGILAIYNLTMPHRPEHIFCSGSPILHSQFHPTEHPQLIIGGASSGQLLVWDARVGRYPVQRSSVGVGGSGGRGGHDCELVGMKVLGDGSDFTGAGAGGSMASSVLVTASSDGKVNYWSMSNLREPAEHVQVPNANLSCLEILPYGEGVVCGDEKGGLHAILTSSGSTSASAAACSGGGGSSGSGSSRRVVRTLHPGGVGGLAGGASGGGWSGSADFDDTDALQENKFDTGHYGMITAVATRPPMMQNHSPRSSNKETTSSSGMGGVSRGFLRGAGGLMVTTGVDWSTKLWAPAYSELPLTSFLSNSYDYMSDAQW